MRRVDQALRRAARTRLNPGGVTPTVAYRRSEPSLEGYPSEQAPLESYPGESTSAKGPSPAEAVSEVTAVIAQRPAPVPTEEVRPAKAELTLPVAIVKAPRVALDGIAGDGKRVASVPVRAVADDHIETPAEFDGRLVISSDADAELVAQFDRLAEALIQAQTERTVRTVMVSSAQPQEGRSFTAVNLALTLSQRYGKRVLLVDADPARPSIHRFFNLQNDAGLFDTLRVGMSQAPLVPVTARLSVLPAGPADPSEAELLASHEMKAFLQSATATFDWVVLDTAAASLLADAHLLAWLVDGVLLVIKAVETSQAIVQRAVAEVGAHRVLGLVLNQVGGRTRRRGAQARSITG